MNTKDKSKLNGKDLISIGIFTAVYFILNLLIAAAMGFTDGYIRKVKADAESRLDSLQEAQVAAALPAWYMRGTKAE